MIFPFFLFLLFSKTYIEKSDSKENKIKEMLTTAKAHTTEENSKKVIDDVESMKKETELSNKKLSYTTHNISSKLPQVILELDSRK